MISFSHASISFRALLATVAVVGAAGFVVGRNSQPPHAKPTPDVWPCAQPMEQPMSSRPLTAVVFVGAVLFGSAMADADPLPSPVTSPVTTVPQAPIGHLQPRAHQISPSAPAEEIEQQRLSTFDAEQQKLDLQL